MSLLAVLGMPAGGLPEASGIAPEVDHVLGWLFGASAFMVVVLGALTLTILVRYRRGSRADRRPLAVSAWRIESYCIGGTVVVFLFFFFEGAGVYARIERIPPGLPAINVTGRQWMWDVRYPDGRREFNRIHVQRGVPVRIVLSSEDVIHSFFVPAFRIKQDAVPGRVTNTWFDPTRSGTYRLFCAQFCGTAHAEMGGLVVVLEPSDYADWVRQGGRPPPGSTPAGRGAALYRRLGCAACHEGAAVAPAPSLRGLYGGTAVMADGRRLRVDEPYLHDALVAGPKFRVAGYPPSMPTFDGILSTADLTDLIAYLETLGSPPPAAPPSP